jgi:DNA-nicking Smr family endonuclease
MQNRFGVRRLDAAFICSPSALSKITKRRRAGAIQTMTEEDYNPFPEPVVIEITDVFDLHTIPPKQVKAVVEEYLHEAHAKGFRVVRIIHGKGRGVQREIVRTILERTPFVNDWTDAAPDAGGLGATIVRLEQSTD